MYFLVRNLRNCSLPVRLILFVFLPILAFAGGFGYLVFNQLEQWSERRMQEDVELIARTLKAPVSRALERRRQGTLEHSLDSVLDIGRVYGAYLYDDTGKLVATSGLQPARSAIDADIYEAVALDEEKGTYGEMAGEAVYSYFVPLSDSGGDFAGLLQVSRLHREMLDELASLQQIGFLFLTLVAGGVMGIIFVGYQGAIGRSLVHLRDTMAKVKTGDRRQRAQCHGPAEVAGLAASFNRMLDSIERAEGEIQRRRASEAELERKLHKTENLAAIGQLAAGVAHELGTPLSVVDGKAQRALRAEHLAPVCRENLDAIRAEVRRMEQIVRQLLEFGRSHDPQRRQVRLDHLLQRAANAVDAVPGRGAAEIKCRGDLPAPWVQVNPVRLELAVINLLKNAVQAKGVAQVLASWRQASNWAEVRVEDDGPGVPREIRERIFQPFFTTRASQEGSGLGLAIVQQVADENGGAVSVAQSALGGAAFQLRLPILAGGGP